MNYKGKAHKVGEHIDTDAIIPARFLVTTDAKKLGEQCMSGLEPDWVKRVTPGDIMVAGRNFGCGSSREHAPIAILGAGMSVVIGHSFARIFYRNSFNMGLLLMTSTTERAISATPAASERLKGSLNTRMPTVTAVRGSMTPRIDVRVEPMRCTARIRVRLETTAVTTASSVASSSSHQDCSGRNVPVIRALPPEITALKAST